MKRRLFSMLIAISMLMGILPVSVVQAERGPGQGGVDAGRGGFAALSGYTVEEDTTPVADSEALEESGLFAMSITYACAAQIDTWASTGHGRDSVMFPVMSLTPMDWEEPIGYFFPGTGSRTLHKLIVYSGKHIEESDIRLGGVRQAGAAYETVYGEGDETLYAYTMPFQAHEDFIISIIVGDKTVAVIPCTQIAPEAPHPYVTNLYPVDYTENKDGYLESFTVKIGGFSLPMDKSAYQFQRSIEEEPFYSTSFAQCSAISEKDEYGEFTLTFTMQEDLGFNDLQWLDLLIQGRTAWFFSKADHLSPNFNGVYNYNGNEQGSNARIASPYAAAARAESTVKLPKFSVPQEAKATPVTIAITPNDYEGGMIAYSTDGGSTWSSWAAMGSALSLPLDRGNGDYTLLFKFQKEELEERQSAPYTVTLAVPDKDPETAPSVTLPATTTSSTVTAAVSYGSYVGGEMACSTDGGKTFSEYRPVAAAWPVALPEPYGVYTVVFSFRKTGYVPYTTKGLSVDYNDGIPAAPTGGGVLDLVAGKEVPKKGDTYLISGEKDSLYCLYAAAPQGQVLEAIFKSADGVTLTTKTLLFHGEKERYETQLTREDMKDAARVELRIRAAGGSPAGHELTLKLRFVEKAFLKALYAPAVPYEVRKDYYALKPGAVIKGAFESASGEDRTHQMTLTYLTAGGESKTVTAAATGDQNGQYTASITLPEDTHSLKEISYQLLSEGKVESSVEYPVTNYRVEANTNVTGIGEEYIGTTFTLKGTDTEKTIVLTQQNYDEIPLGDIKTGEYTYEISGTSGHIVGGTVSVLRDGDISLSDLPALGSVTAQTTGFASKNSGKELNPKASVVLALQTPDGKEIKIRSAAGEKMEQIPVGSTGKAELSYDQGLYDEIQSLSGASQEVTVTGDERVTAEYQPFTYRTISGSVFGSKIYPPSSNWPSGRESVFVPWRLKIIVTQEVTRGGHTETVVKTTTTDNAKNGRWSVECYDNIPAKVEVKSLSWDTETRVVTEKGNVKLGEIRLTSGGEAVVELRAQVQTPASVNADGSPRLGAMASQTGQVDSSFLQVTSLTTGGHIYHSYDTALETYQENGRTYLKIPEGVTMGNELINISARGTVDYGGMSLSVDGDASVSIDDMGNWVASYTAINQGGEIRATVVDDPNAGYTGFLVMYTGEPVWTGNGWTGQSCFAAGTGELSLPYSRNMAGGERTIIGLKVRNDDVDDMRDILQNDCTKLYDVLPNGDMQHDAYYRLRDYDRKLPYTKVGLPQNRIVYLDDLMPRENIGTEFLPPYRFTYHFELSDNPGKIWMIGTLEKRFPEQVNKDPMRSFEIFVPGNDELWTISQEDLVANSQFYGDGRLIMPPAVWMKDTVTTSTVTAELPLSKGNMVGFHARLKYGGSWDGSNSSEQNFTCIEHVPMFSIINPGDVYIADQLKAQGLASKPEEAQGGWKLNLALRVFNTDDPSENYIRLYDNGMEVLRFNVSKSRYEYNDTGESIILGGNIQRLQVPLTDNLKAGVHVLWAERTYHGEVMQTEPVVFSLIEGAEHNEVYISELKWTHWNSRIPGKPDEMYFENLSEIAGANIWVWPGKRHQMQFKVNNATSRELDGVSVVYSTLADRGQQVQDSSGNILSSYSRYVSVKQKIECKLITENRNANYSIWGFDDADMGYLQGFEFEFDYNAGIDKDLANMDIEQLDQLETEAFYQANRLGEVPDVNELAGIVSGMSDEELKYSIGAMAETSEAVAGMDLRVTEDTDKSFAMELKTPTKEISKLDVSVKENGTQVLPDIWNLMETEREKGNQNPDEKGWDVNWAEFDTKQGSILIRSANFEGTLEDGRPAILSHSTYYIPEAVSDTLFTGGSGAKLMGKEQPRLLAESSAAVRNVLSEGKEYSEAPTHWTKNVYDISAYVYGMGDLGFNGLKDALWLDYKVSHLEKTSDTFKRYLDMKNWGETSKFAKGINTTFQVLGVADCVMTYKNGPSGNDPNDLRVLLSLIKDEKARKSLEWQIKDYEEMRSSIYHQDCTMSTISAASGFVPGMGLVGKLVTFIGGLGNTYLSNEAKYANQQVYNSTLHDIRLQIEIERRREEVYKKSLAEAEQWMRDRMDHFYGKGHWGQYALEEELKYWVLVKFPNGTVKYVWHEKVPDFTVYIDPSGYVFEAVEDNRIDGVRATLYYSDTQDGNYAVWKDATGEQYNPQYTGDEGRYSWMVPTGWWKVLYEKDGYLPAWTKPMSVPPIHTAVNVGLLSTEGPKAAVSVGSGTITVLFSKYMQLESLVRLFGEETYAGSEYDAASFAIQFYDQNGIAIPGRVTLPDKIANTGYVGSVYSAEVIDSAWFVRTAIFTPEDQTADLSGAAWTFSDGIRSYSGVELNTTESPENLYLITLDPGEGTLSIPSLITNEKGSLSKLPAPTREGYTFDGWYTSQTGGTEVTADTVFDASATLYAHWTEESTDSGDPGDTEEGGGYDSGGSDGGGDYDSGDYGGGGGSSGGGSSEVTPPKPEEGAENPFVDVKTDDYFYEAVLWAVKANITNGTSDTTFSPNDSCTRAQTVTFLWRAAGSPEPTMTANPFTDIQEEDYFYKAVLWAYEKGITKGTGDAVFSPDATVTRGQTITLLYRMSGEKPQGEKSFADVQTGEYYYDSVRWAYENNITKGTAETTFSPEDNCLRGQVVTFLYRYQN